MLAASFREDMGGRAHKLERPEGAAPAEFGNNLLPVDVTHRSQTSPIFNYPYRKSRESLDTLARMRDPDPWQAHKMKFINPVNGGWAMPTISTWMQLLPKGFKSAPYRSTDSAVFTVVEGHGRSTIGGETFNWGPHDIFVAPSWMAHTHEASEDAVLFIYLRPRDPGEARHLARVEGQGLKRQGLRRSRILAIGAAVLAVAIAAAVVTRANADWRTASRAPVGLAPDPAAHPEAIVQVYAARTVGWRGTFGVHTWVAVKPAQRRRLHRVRSHRLEAALGRHRGLHPQPRARRPLVRQRAGADRRARGKDAEALIPRIEAAAKTYPVRAGVQRLAGAELQHLHRVDHARGARAARGPAAHRDRQGLPRRRASSPRRRAAAACSCRSAGVLGVTASSVEGLELNLLGLTFGLDPWPPALKLPLVGRLGAPACSRIGRCTAAAIRHSAMSAHHIQS